MSNTTYDSAANRPPLRGRILFSDFCSVGFLEIRKDADCPFLYSSLCSIGFMCPPLISSNKIVALF